MIHSTAFTQYIKFLSAKPDQSLDDGTEENKNPNLSATESSPIVNKGTSIKKSIYHLNENIGNEDIIPLLPFPPSQYERQQRKVNFDITIPIHLQIPDLEMGKGQIYLASHPFSDKIYIGQADNYINGNTLFGTDGRWKTHVRAASNAKDDCPHFYNALRKYGMKNFQVFTLITAPLSELDYWEKFFIQLFNSFADNGHGYNHEKGGKKNREFSQATREKMRQSRKNIIVSDEAKNNIRLGNIGKRLQPQKRKYAEDRNLPTYIQGNREDGKLVGYSVHFTASFEKQKILQKSFRNPANLEKALEDAKKQLAEWQIEYKDLPAQIKKRNEERMATKIVLSLEQKYNQRNPEYIFCKMVDNKIRGYFVRGYPDHEDNPYPEVEFSEFVSNTDNKNAAIRYIESLRIKNLDVLFKEYIPEEVVEWAKEEKKANPQTMRRRAIYKHLAPTIFYDTDRETKEVLGYKIRFRKADGTLYNEMFTAKNTMEEKYKQAIDKLIELIREKRKAVANNELSE
ncbi:MAG: hypothetical protein Harvfovirus10_29 [Harvfovirus sp.]|uniref:GIY-YIG domain-containing protein n=1 Tax=Harvfovirus sp. TaxID=2487768 RepID=A0A3G5A3Z3_9VIRU|nr:MAG: hypothetical protein Harvfovirus10_29 [Harvfovirus sp.]